MSVNQTINCGNCGADSGIEPATSDGATAARLQHIGWIPKYPVVIGVFEWLIACTTECSAKLLARKRAEYNISSETPPKKTRNTIKKLFIRPYPSRLAPPGEIQIGWNFTDESGAFDLPFGAIGLGNSREDQDARLTKIIAELRESQKSLGNVHDFEIDDRRI